MAYLLDTNVFIEAKNRHYGLDFCPAFWDWIDHAHQAGTVFSIDKVAIELDAVDDDLATWASERPDAFFLEADAAVVPSSQATSTWANGARYEPAAVATFLQDSDYYLVAHAHAQRHVVVTHEVVAHHEEDQDRQCLPRCRRALRHAVRDAPSRTGPLRHRVVKPSR